MWAPLPRQQKWLEKHFEMVKGVLCSVSKVRSDMISVMEFLRDQNQIMDCSLSQNGACG
jgi:hypothetical protein